MKKIISILLITAFISSLLLSCGDNTSGNDNSTTTTTSGNAANQSAEENNSAQQEERLDPGLPERDYEGYTFTFLSHLYEGGDWVNPTPLELIAEEETGDPINDAVYRRNMTIQEKYNIGIRMVPDKDCRAVLKRAVSAGDSMYDAVLIYGDHISSIITDDLLLDTSQLPYIDLDKPWWDSAVQSLSIVNKNYLLAGDLLILDNEATNVLLFNKKLKADLGLDLPYNLVKEGKWTMDAMNSIIKDASADLNGDGQMSAFEDRWGFTVFSDTLHALLVSGGGALADKDENDIPFMDFTSAKNISVLDKAMNLLYNPEYVLFAKNIPAIGRQAETGLEVYKAGFEEDRILYLWARMRVIELFRGMDSDFGVVPLPKYDEAQEDYYSVVNPFTVGLLGIPKNAEDLERVSIILEALAAESRYTLKPAYYEVVLQRKYTRDEESGEMLDIIFNSRVYDIGGTYSFSNIYRDFLDFATPTNSDRNIASFYEKRSAKVQAAIDKVVDIFEAMD